MKLDTTSFVDQMTARLKTFPQTCSAAALFYDGHNSSLMTRAGFRLECPAIGKEFTDIIKFGKDPEGFLFYYDLNDFDPAQKTVNYHTFYNNETPMAIRVDFHSLKANGTEDAQPFCTFLTRQTAGIPSDFVHSILSDGSTGTWNDVTNASSYGKIRKERVSNEVTITLGPIGKEIVIDARSNEVASLSLDLMGTFTFLSLTEIAAGTYMVDFNADRVIIYDAVIQTKVIGFFIPVAIMSALAIGNSRQTATIKDIPVGN